MSKCDRATEAEVASFADNKDKILSSTETWEFNSKKYLEAVLNGLEMMTAHYSYGNGEIVIEDRSMWKTLDPELIIPMINRVTKPGLNIEVSEIRGKFPTELWFEMGRLINDSDKAYEQSSNVVVLDPDVAEVFRDSVSVNEALRLLTKIAKSTAV